MPGTSVDVTTKTTVVFGTSGFTADILSIGFAGITVETINTSHFGTSLPSAGNFGAQTKIPACLVDAGDFTMEVHFNPFTPIPVGLAAETITVTFPLASGDSTSTIWAFTGFVTSEDITGPLEDKMVANLTISISGEVTVVQAT